jgi:hypothetical protein
MTSAGRLRFEYSLLAGPERPPHPLSLPHISWRRLCLLKTTAGWSILASVLEQNYGLIRVRVPTIVSSPRGRDFFDGRSTPRIANRLLRRVRDFAQVNELPIVTRGVALGASELLERMCCNFGVVGW